MTINIESMIHDDEVSFDLVKEYYGILPLCEAEPLMHSHRTDKLPDSHPWAFEEVFCNKCTEMVHCFNNECMRMWIESFDQGKEGAYCYDCYIMLDFTKK